MRVALARSKCPAHTLGVVALCEHHNWIAGGWRSAQDERWYAGPRTALAPHAERLDHRWPDSGERDVQSAVEAAGAAAPVWFARSRAERWEHVERLAQALVRECDVASLAEELGLDAQEFAPWQSEHELRLMEALELHREGLEAPGVVAFGAHWSDGAAMLLARLGARLISGQTAIVLVDSRTPHAGEALARALETSTLPSGVVNIVHAQAREARDALLSTPGLALVRWKAPQHELEQLSQRFAARVGPHWEWWRCANRSVVVCERDNLEESARSIAEQSFSRAATLGGQLPGHVARVFCHQRSYSRLCEELRGRLLRDVAASRPCRALEEDLERHVLAQWTLGLDEGATAILGAAPAARAQAAAEAPAGIVFVNVDPAGALAQASRPAPVLSLVRVASDEEGRGLAEDLDLGPRWRPDLTH